MGELTPLTRAQAAEFREMDRPPVPVRWDPQVAGLSLADVRKPVMGAAAAVSAMSQIAALSGQGNEDLIKAAAALQMTAGALEVISALRGVLQLRTAIKAAEAAAHITKWGPAALAVGAAAAGGAAIYALTMEQQEFNFEGDYSTGAGQREMMMQLEGTR